MLTNVTYYKWEKFHSATLLKQKIICSWVGGRKSSKSIKVLCWRKILNYMSAHILFLMDSAIMDPFTHENMHSKYSTSLAQNLITIINTYTKHTFCLGSRSQEKRISPFCTTLYFFHPHPRIFFYFFIDGGERERERERKRERGGKRERHWCERETPVSCLPYTPQPGIEPSTQIRALMGDQTHDLLVYGMVFQPPKPPGYGNTTLYIVMWLW